MEKVLLLYSGGLDTSCMLKWLQEEFDADVLTLTLDVGQRNAHLKASREKALQLGAEKAFVEDVREEYADRYIARAIKANGLYQGQYPLGTAIARPLKSEIAVEYAVREGVDAIAHGSTGKGNDQVRFDVSISALKPSMNVIAPVREWNMSREEELAYAQRNDIPLPIDVSSPYSIDENLWGRSIECGVLEDPGTEPPSNVFELCLPLEETPDDPEYITLEFDSGLPVAVNGTSMKLSNLIEKVNGVAGRHGVGVIDMVEDRVVGLKSREIYECPAAVTIINAHRDLEKYCCTIHENSFKSVVDQRWAEMAYKGLMFDPLLDDLDAFVDQVNQKVSGTVNLKLFKGQARVVGRNSENGLYNYSLATYSKESSFDQSSSKGFIDIWGLPTRVAFNNLDG